MLPYLATYTDPSVCVRTFTASGLNVLHTPAYTSAAFAARIDQLIRTMGPRTTLELAGEEHAPAGLVAEMIREAEMLGAICRDEIQTTVGLTAGAGEGAGEVHWWNNIFEQYVWDGQD